MSPSGDTPTREIRLPALSATMEEATLLAWKVSPGDDVREGQAIAEVSTDKVDMDLESPFSGTIVALLAEPGATVPLGGILASVATSEEDLLGGLDLAGDEPAEVPAAAETEGTAGTEDEGTTPDEEVGGRPAEGSIVPASPPARKMARQLGIDLAEIAPTGTRGQVTPADVKRHHESREQTTPEAPAPGPATPEERPPAAQAAPAASEDPRRLAVRRATVDVMATSVSVPQFTLYRTLRLEAAARRKGGESWTTILVRGLAAALRRYPELNARWDDERREPVPFAAHRVGLAIDRPGIGLVVASVDGPDVLALEDADAAVRRIADRARTGKLEPADMAQPSITLSNLGGLGVERFNALLFPPQAAILSAGTIAMRPIATADGALKAALTCEVGLTVDHRVGDGADGARFLETFAEIVEHA